MKPVKMSEMDEMIPLKFYLSQNYPNPFKEKTTIKYCVAYRTRVTITISDQMGLPVECIMEKEQDAGTYEIEFDGSKFQAGNYFVKIKADSYANIKKMILSK